MQHSYHIFYFPFKWENRKMKHKSFSGQTSLDELTFKKDSNWRRCPGPLNAEESDMLYNEMNYYYQFVHPVLYDNKEKESILKHFERKETQQEGHLVKYKITTGEKTYTLKVDAINLNLYTTGVGMLSFFLINEQDDQKSPEDILKINQFGRRIFPPFIEDVEIRSLIPQSISIEGLQGNGILYYEDFTGYREKKHPKDSYKKAWTPSSFIRNLITDLVSDIEVIPVIDDRMFVNCWYCNEVLSNEIKDKEKYEDFVMNGHEDFWFQYVFVDSEGATCKNEQMKKNLLEDQTYSRWQEAGCLFGISRYSLVALTDTSDFANDVLAKHMRTMYSRMIELVLIQRASALNFSDEVARVNGLSKGKKGDKILIHQISDLHLEYIRFVNKICFEEVTTQDQGVEMYNLMLKVMNLDIYIKNLDDEIEELHHYLSSLDDRIRNKNSEMLNKIAAVFLPATLITGLFGMNGNDNLPCINSFGIQLIIVAVVIILSCGSLMIFFKKK